MVNVGNYPYIKTDANNREIQDSSGDMAFQGEYTGANLIYKGFARPGTQTDEAKWQISFLTYSGDNLVSIEWPENDQGNASTDYEFVWDDRASYTYV